MSKVGASGIQVLVLAALLAAEYFFPLRRVTQRRLPRLFKNFSLAALWAFGIRVLAFPMLIVLAQWCESRSIGFLNLWPMNPLLKTGLGVLGFDFSVYYWHRLNHSRRFLWRFHSVHHCDLDMDVSTAARFHFGELFLSVFFQALQIALLGAGLEALFVYHAILTSSVMFHHSNVRLPKSFERIVNYLFVTPRMHGIHHSMVLNETDSNFSSILNLWDRMHNTLRLEVDQDLIKIGIPAFPDAQELKFSALVLMPFKRPRVWPAGFLVRPCQSETGTSEVP